MDIWVVNSTNGVLYNWGWFETYEECQKHCMFLREGVSFGIDFIPLKITKA